jgi:hypothetical protein
MSLAASLRSDVSKERLTHFVENITKFERPATFPGEMENLNFIRGELEKVGLKPKLHSFEAWISMPEEASLEVLSPEQFSIPCKTRAFSPSTPEEGIVGELVYVEKAAMSGKGSSIFEYRKQVESGGGFSDTDVKGKIVLSRSGGPDGYNAAQEAGAVCQIALWPSEEDVIHELTVNGVWGTATPESASRLPKMISISIKNPDGERLVALCEKGQVQVRVRAKTHTRWDTIHVLTAQVESPTDSSLFTMVGGHHCSWHYGCTDNSTGCGCLMELATVLQGQRESLKHNVRFCWWAGHSQGRYAGSTWYIDNYFEDLSKNCIGYLNIDSPGVRGATEYEGRYIMAEAEHFTLEAIKKVSGQDAPVKPPYRAGDQSFLNAGITSMGAYSMLAPDDPDWALVGGCAGAWWWHSEEDTIDKWSADILATDCEIFLEIISSLSASDVLPFHMGRIGEHIGQRVDKISQDDKTGFDLAPIGSAVARYAKAASRLAEVVPGVTDEKGQRILNQTYLGACRFLNTVLYSMEGNYEQDPALQKPVLPGLSQLSSLQSMDSTSSDYHFLRTYLVRERNRVVDALDRAGRLIGDAADILG